jgi:hypothetical protein
VKIIMAVRLTTMTIVLATALFACHVQTQTAQESVPAGEWGGKGIQLIVTEKGGTVDYGCDSGTIDERLTLDARGRFTVRGTHAFGRGGPRRQGDAPPRPRQAIYQGVRKGQKLEVTVSLPDLNRKLGPFTLERDKPPTLERCG